jgi:tetratricopeptide (TPR) repeat protein
MGRNEEAIVQVKQAIELDPLSPDNRNQLAMISFTSRNFDLATDAWSAPLALSYAERNRFDEALAAAKSCEIRWGSDYCFVVQSQVYGLWGRTRDARKAIDQLKEISHHRFVYPRFSVRRIWRLAIRSRLSLGWSEPTTRRTLGFSG